MTQVTAKDDYLIPENIEAEIMFEFEQDVYGDNFDILMEKWVKEIESSGINSEKVWFASNSSEQGKFRILRHRILQRVNEIIRKK